MGKKPSVQHKDGRHSPDVAAKWAKALAARAAGKTFDQIATEVGYSNRGTAYNAVMAAIKATLQEPTEAARVVEVERLDRLMGGVWDRAVGGDDYAIDRVLKIMDRRARLLGLDAPQEFKVDDARKSFDVTNPPDQL